MSTPAETHIEQQALQHLAESKKWRTECYGCAGCEDTKFWPSPPPREQTSNNYCLGTGLILRYSHPFAAVFEPHFLISGERCNGKMSASLADLVADPVRKARIEKGECPDCVIPGYVVRPVVEFLWDMFKYHKIEISSGGVQFRLEDGTYAEAYLNSRHPGLAIIEALGKVLPEKESVANG